MRPQVLLFFALSGFFLYLGTRAIKSGRMKIRGSIFYRNKSPFLFWLTTTLMLSIAAVCLVAPFVFSYVF